MTGIELRDMRNAAGWSQRRLADALGLHKSAVCDMEYDKRRISIAEAYVIANLLTDPDFDLTSPIQRS